MCAVLSATYACDKYRTKNLSDCPSWSLILVISIFIRKLTFSVKVVGGRLLDKLVCWGMKYSGWFGLLYMLFAGGKFCTGGGWFGMNCDGPGSTDGGGTFGGNIKLFALGGAPTIFGWEAGIGWLGGKLVFTGTGGCWIRDGDCEVIEGGGIAAGLCGCIGGVEPIKGIC